MAEVLPEPGKPGTSRLGGGASGRPVTACGRSPEILDAIGGHGGNELGLHIGLLWLDCT